MVMRYVCPAVPPDNVHCTPQEGRMPDTTDGVPTVRPDGVAVTPMTEAMESLGASGSEKSSRIGTPASNGLIADSVIMR